MTIQSLCIVCRVSSSVHKVYIKRLVKRLNIDLYHPYYVACIKKGRS